MSDSAGEGIQTDEGGGGKNCEPQLHVGTRAQKVQPVGVFL